MEAKDIIAELEEYQQFLEQLPSDNPDEMARMLAELNTLIARSGMLLAEAKKLYNDKVNSVMNKDFIEMSQLSPTIGKMYAESQCSEELMVVTWAERINRSSVHISDNLRTLISLAKENLKLTRKGY